MTGIGAAAAQSPDHPAARSHMHLFSAAEPKQPRLMSVDSRIGAKATTYMQVNGPTKSSGALAEVSVKVEPFDAVIKAKGHASKTGSAPIFGSW